MTIIKELFDPSKDIFRSIEKVVTFGSLKTDHLKSEISEYVVTERLKNNFEKILDAMSAGMQTESHEVGIWISGFYGSGKSSFAKYFGLGLKKNYSVDGTSFQERLVNRINSTPISQQLKTLVDKYDPEVFLIDLATQTIAGYTMAPVGTIIYNEIMKWAGYALEEKISLLERKLEIDGKLDEFKNIVKTEKKEDWDALKFEDRLTAKGIAQDLAPRFYPNIWNDANSFNITKIDDIESDREKTIQMLSLIKKKTGKENVLFVIDEVGQYVASDNALILKLQGTMENLKDIGNGKVWLIATAQQTLTEDNPNARFNSDKLYKLNARFPIPIDIEASDIKEITTKRLLGKSLEGSNELKALFARHGEVLRLNTRLTKVEKTQYKAELDEKSFIDLYPFLPHHFDLLLALLGRLAKKTGGMGLRSAIRVIQDVLTDKTGDMLAEGNIGSLANTAHIYNVLRSDIKKSYPHITNSVEKVVAIFNEESEEAGIAKTIATLQILDDFHLSIENLAVMMHPSVEVPSQLDNIKLKVNDLKNTLGLTLKEIDGQLRFMTDAIIRLEDEKLRIMVSSSQVRKVFESQIEDIFSIVPTARIANTKSVKSGIQLMYENRISKLSESSEEIQTEIFFSLRSNYESELEGLKYKSTEPQNSSRIFLIGLIEEIYDNILEEIVRCEEVASWKNKYDDKEILDYINSQYQEAQKLKDTLRRKLKASLESGEFLFRGSSKTCKSLSGSVGDAANIWLKSSAEKVFHKYDLAPITIESAASQRLLQFDDLRSITSSLNSFGIIRSDGSIDTVNAAIKEIENYLQSEGQVDGRKLLEKFQDAPCGWHKDTTRYLITLMFLASIIKLRIAGDTVTVKGPLAIEKLSTAAAFNQIGISLHSDDQPTTEQKLCAAKNLTELTKTTVIPLPQKISETVMKFFPEFQRDYAELKIRLKKLDLPGIDKAESIQEGIAEILKGDASDATFSLGKHDSKLFQELKWAKKVKSAFDNGIDDVLEKIKRGQKEIVQLPSGGLTGQLKDSVKIIFDDIDRILQSDNFFEQAASLNELSTKIEIEVASTCQNFESEQNENIIESIEELKQTSEWGQLNDENKQEFSDRLNNALLSGKNGISGIIEILGNVLSFNSNLKIVKTEINESIRSISVVSGVDPFGGIPQTKKTKPISLSHISKRIQSKEDVDVIIKTFTNLKDNWNDDEVIDIKW
jgi:hypothetical protein